MKYRSVGKSGLKISEVALGSWVTDLKGTAAEDVAKETVKLAYDSGVNFFDCADAYSGGAAERFLGKTLKQYPRKELVISSKVYFPTGEGVNDRGLSRKHIFESIDQTLKNMQTDYLDMYFCHRFDETTDLTETLRAMSDLVAQGKVLYYGVSEEWGQGRERHELRGPLVAGHVRMLARLMVWQVDDVVVCMGLLQGHARWPPI